MADGDNGALDSSEQGDDVLDQQGGNDFSQPPPAATAAPQGATQANSGPPPLPGGGVRSTNDDDAAAGPQVSGKAKFLGNLVKTVLAGVQNAPGNPNNAFARGFMNASPNNQKLQQAKVQTAQSDADQAKIQTSITGMKALQTEYLLKRLPIEDQEKHMEVISKFKDNLIKEGASVEAEAEDEKAGDAQAMHLNGTDPRATNHAGHFWSLPTMGEDGKAKFDVVYVPTKDTLQNDFTWDGADGESHTIPAGTPMMGLPKMVEQLQKDVQGDTKDQHKQMADALKPNVPDGEIPQTVGWLKNQKDQNTPLYQQNKNQVDAQINMLNAARGQINSDKLAQARAMSEQKNEITDEETQKGIKNAVSYADQYLNTGKYTGAGDFALTEQYLEAVRVSKGFRSGTAIFDRIDQGRSWAQSAAEKWQHGTTGVLFSDKQRKEIAATMHQMAVAKKAEPATATQQFSHVSASGKFGWDGTKWVPRTPN